MTNTIRNNYKKFIFNLRRYGLDITIVASLFLIFVFLGAMLSLYVQSSPIITFRPESTVAYRQDFEKSSNQENAQREWKRLHKYHGYPAAVVYEEGKTPYFYDKQGSKCAFIDPPKEAEVLTHQATDNEYYATLTLNKELMINDKAVSVE